MAPSTSLSAGCPKQRITQTPPDSHQKAASGTGTSTTGYCGGTCQRCISSISTIVPRTAPDPQQFQLAAALRPASRNKRTNTQDKLTAFLSTSFKTLCCKTHCHLSLFPAQVSTGPQTTFFHSGAIKTLMFFRNYSPQVF